jgi:hypothetical protein
LLGAGYQHDEVGLERDHGFQAGVEQPSHDRNRGQLGMKLSRVLLDPDQHRGRAERDEDRGERGVHRDDPPRRRRVRTRLDPSFRRQYSDREQGEEQRR